MLLLSWSAKTTDETETLTPVLVAGVFSLLGYQDNSRLLITNTWEVPSMAHQWVTIQAITPNQDRLARMAQLRRERNARGDTTPYRHAHNAIQAWKRKEAAHEQETHQPTSGLLPPLL